MGKPGKIWGLIVALALTAALSASFLHSRPVYTPDSVTYLEGARSLARAEGFLVDGSPITTFPPGYPAVLSLFMLIGIDSIVFFKAINILTATVALLAFRTCLSKALGSWRTALLITLCGVFFPWIYYTQALLADITLAAIFGVFLWSGDSYCRTGKAPGIVVACVAAAAALLVRNAGMALIPVLLLVGLRMGTGLRSAPRAAAARTLSAVIACAVALAPFVLFLWRNYEMTGAWLGYDTAGVDDEYRISLQKIGITDYSIFNRIWVNVRGYIHILVIPDQAGIAAVSRLNPVIRLACAGVWICIACGWIRSLIRREQRLWAALFGSYSAMLLLNTWYDIRYVLPVLPLFFLFLVDGAAWFASCVVSSGARLFKIRVARRRLESWVCRVLLAGLILVNLGVVLGTAKGRKLRSREYEGEAQRLYEACLFIKSAKTEGALLVPGGRGFTAVWTGRKVRSALALNNATGNDEVVTNIPTDVVFILLSESKFMPYREMYAEPMVAANADRLTEAYRDGNTIVFQVSCKDAENRRAE